MCTCCCLSRRNSLISPQLYWVRKDACDLPALPGAEDALAASSGSSAPALALTVLPTGSHCESMALVTLKRDFKKMSLGWK